MKRLNSFGTRYMYLVPVLAALVAGRESGVAPNGGARDEAGGMPDAPLSALPLSAPPNRGASSVALPEKRPGGESGKLAIAPGPSAGVPGSTSVPLSIAIVGSSVSMPGGGVCSGLFT